MVETPRAPIRTDRLRPLNVPCEVFVELMSEDGRERTKAAGSGRTRGSTAHGSGLRTQDSTTNIPSGVRLDGHLKPVIAIREMWEIEDEWWRDHIARRYFDVVLKGGKHLVLYQNRLTGKWYAQTP